MKARTYEIDGVLYTVKDLAQKCGIGTKAMHKRLQIMSPEEALNYVAKPRHSFQPNYYTYKDTEYTIDEFAALIGKGRSYVERRIKMGWSLEQIEEDSKIEKPKTNNHPPKKYLWRGRELDVKEIAQLENIDSSNLYRKLKSGLSIDDAIASIKGNKPILFPYKGRMCTRNEIILDAPNISPDKLYKELKCNVFYTEEEVKEIIDRCNRTIYYCYNGQSLYQYCIENKYNYYVVRHLIISQGLNVQQAIDLYLEQGQGDPKNGSFFTGNILLSHFCIKQKLDVTYIKRLLKEGYDIRKAIVNCCFNSYQNYSTKVRRRKLSVIYEVWEILNPDDQIQIEQHYNLTKLDIIYLQECDKRIKEILYEYNLFMLDFYISESINLPEAKQILSDNNLTLEQSIDILRQLYDPFESLEINAKAKYKWKG